MIVVDVLAQDAPQVTLVEDDLDKAYQERESGMLYLAAAPEMRSLSKDPRYRALLERVGFDVSG